MSKVIAIMNKPDDCQECVFGICKYSHPFWSKDKPNKKGYYCQLKKPKDRKVEEFDYEDNVHLQDCPLRPVPEKKEVTGKSPQPNGEVPSYKIGFNDCLKEIGVNVNEQTKTNRM